MAEFISNSAILTATLPRSALTVAPNSGPGREKWQTLRQILPSLNSRCGIFLLCAHCNRVKGDRPQEDSIARLHELGIGA